MFHGTLDANTRVAVRIAAGLDDDTTGVATGVAIGVASPLRVNPAVTTGVARPITRGFGGFRVAARGHKTGSGNVRRGGFEGERSLGQGARAGENRPALVATVAVTQLPPIAWAVGSARDVRRLVRREERVV